MLKLSDFDLEFATGSEVRIHYRTKGGLLRDCTGTIKSENADKLFLRQCKFIALPKYQIKLIEEA